MEFAHAGDRKRLLAAALAYNNMPQARFERRCGVSCVLLSRAGGTYSLWTQASCLRLRVSGLSPSRRWVLKGGRSFHALEPVLSGDRVIAKNTTVRHQDWPRQVRDNGQMREYGAQSIGGSATVKHQANLKLMPRKLEDDDQHVPSLHLVEAKTGKFDMCGGAGWRGQGVPLQCFNMPCSAWSKVSTPTTWWIMTAARTSFSPMSTEEALAVEMPGDPLWPGKGDTSTLPMLPSPPSTPHTHTLTRHHSRS